MIRGLLVTIIVLVLAIAGTGLGLWHYGKREFYGAGAKLDASYFYVERGASFDRVATALAGQGLISNRMIFRAGARYTEQDGQLKFGNYEIPPHASMAQILDLLTDSTASRDQFLIIYRVSAETGTTLLLERLPGSESSTEIARFTSRDPVPEQYSAIIGSETPVAYRIAIPEGLTNWQVAEALKEARFLQGTLHELPAEGLLAPDTYEVARGHDRATLINQMMMLQQEILEAEWTARATGHPVATPQEALILASLIEKESSEASERELVASVFVNRLNLPMRLQADPSVMYGITEGKRPLGRGLRQSELERETPYNTYIMDGLPPTPIANPGRAAIRAALNPALTDYLYFVADGKGGHAFASTYKEHRQNVRKWRQVEAARKREN